MPSTLARAVSETRTGKASVTISIMMSASADSWSHVNFVSTLRTHARCGIGLCVLWATASGVAQTLPNGSRNAQPARGTLTIDSVLTLASKQHPLIEAARARVTAANGSRRTAGAFANPVATYQVENAGYPGSGSALPVGTQRETSAFLTLPIEPLFQRGPRVRRANEGVNAATADLAQATQDVIRSAARAFYSLATAQAVHDEAKEEFENYKRLLEYNRVRVSEGAAPEGDLLRVQVEVTRAATAAVTAQVEVIRAQAHLRLYVERERRAQTPTPSDGMRAYVPRGPANENALLTIGALMTGLEERRPDLVGARARTAKAAADVSYQRTLALRQVGAILGNKRIGDVNTVMAGMSLPIPLFDLNRGEIQRANAERTVAQQEFAWQALQVKTDLEAAHEVALEFTRQLSTLEPSFLDRADESRRVTQAAYEEGAASLVDVLNATRAYGDARLTYFRLLHAQRESMIDLAIAAGRPATTFLSQLRSPDGPDRDESSRRRDER